MTPGGRRRPLGDRRGHDGGMRERDTERERGRERERGMDRSQSSTSRINWSGDRGDFIKTSMMSQRRTEDRDDGRIRM